MLQKFQIGFKQNITCNGKVEAVVIVTNEEASHKHDCASEMLKMISFLVEHECISDDSIHEKCKQLLAKARGE